jgi:DNA-binding transcriptional MerR regulator
MQKALTVAEAARELGRSERWLRQAEHKGKIPKARRDLNGWRVYTLQDIATIRELLVPSFEQKC